MEQTTPVSPTTRDEVDWADVRSRFHRYLRPRFASRGEAFVQDLASEAIVRLVFAFERGPVTNLHGLIVTICKRTEVDAIRSIRRYAARFEALPEHFDPAAPPPPIQNEEDDSLYRLRWASLECLKQGKAACCELAERLFAGLTLLEVADDLGRSYVGVRQQWSRCRKHLIATMSLDAGPLWEWIHERE